VLVDALRQPPHAAGEADLFVCEPGVRETPAERLRIEAVQARLQLAEQPGHAYERLVDEPRGTSRVRRQLTGTRDLLEEDSPGQALRHEKRRSQSCAARVRVQDAGHGEALAREHRVDDRLPLDLQRLLEGQEPPQHEGSAEARRAGRQAEGIHDRLPSPAEPGRLLREAQIPRAGDLPKRLQQAVGLDVGELEHPPAFLYAVVEQVGQRRTSRARQSPLHTWSMRSA
jgi:hypothetical protein